MEKNERTKMECQVNNASNKQKKTTNISHHYNSQSRRSNPRSKSTVRGKQAEMVSTIVKDKGGASREKSKGNIMINAMG